MSRETHHIVIDAPVERVWRALTQPAEVSQWDGAVPILIPDGYPAPGQHALWRTRLGPFPVKLHDRVHTVVPLSRLGSTIDVGFIHVDEDYRLGSVPSTGGAELRIDHEVSTGIPGLGWLAVRMVNSDLARSMERLRRLCASEEADSG